MVWYTQQQPERSYIENLPYNWQTPPDNMDRIIPAQKVHGMLSPERIGTITNALTRIQQVLKTVENAAPIIQQYGPMVKNLPAMFKIMKALKESEDAEGYNEDETEEEKTEKDFLSTYEENVPGSSKPKLFI